MKIRAEPCPCGDCRKWIVRPLINCVEASLSKEDADELVRRWNSFEEEPKKALTKEDVEYFFNPDGD